MKQLCDHCTRINGGKSCLHLGDTNKIKHDGYWRLMTPKRLILQVFLNFVRHFGFPWCTFDLKTLLVLFDSDCRRCFTYSCVYMQGITQGNTWGRWELIPPSNSFTPEAWFMVAASSGKSQGYKDFLNVREYTSLKEVWQNLK